MATFSDGGDVASMADYDTQDNMRLLLQTLLDSKEKQLQSAATLGHQLLAQRTELEDKIRQMQELELDSTGSDEDRKSTRLNSSHSGESRMPSSA